MEHENNFKSTASHDSAIRATLENVMVARDFLQQYLPQSIQNKLDLNTLKILPGHFIGTRLRKQETDVLYACSLKNHKNNAAWIYTLIEHQSKPDYWIALRLWKYCCAIWKHYLKQNPKSKVLPVIVPIVFYNGKQMYSFSTDFLDLFGEQKSLAQQTLYHAFQLIDLNKIPDEHIRKHTWCGLLELFLKHARTGDIKKLIDKALQYFQPLLQHEESGEYLAVMVYYASNWSHEKPTALLKYIENKLPKEAGEKMKRKNPFAQYFEEIGEERGARTEKLHVARKMLNSGCNPIFIREITSLSLQEIQELPEQDS